jgi:NAD(P)-dependent dehydrogenase (short-subunit alcohol dehydrogenase family)
MNTSSAIPNTCLITGASGGVATALAAILRTEGWRLALVGRDRSRLVATEGDIAIEADVATEAGARDALEAAKAAFGQAPAAVVNCAGAVLIAPIGRTSEQQYRDCLSANLDTAFFVAKAYVAALQAEKRGGALVFFSSVAAGVGVGNHPAIAAAKGGVEALTRSLAADASGLGLRVNAIAPGLMDTPATAKFVSSELARKAVSAQYPLGRHGTADDAAALAAFLVSPRAGWISGQIIAVDGGFLGVRPTVKVS